MYGLHRNEEFFPEPDQFDPERFSESISQKRNPFTYLPFGQAGLNGSDISIQLGILATKIILYRLVERFKFSGSEEKNIYDLFERGFTRIPRPKEISLVADTRI